MSHPPRNKGSRRESYSSRQRSLGEAEYTIHLEPPPWVAGTELAPFDLKTSASKPLSEPSSGIDKGLQEGVHHPGGPERAPVQIRQQK